MAVTRWGGLRPEPYDPNAVDADGDGIVQEGTAWERPAGTGILDELGRAITRGANSDKRPKGVQVVDRAGNPVSYKPSYGDAGVKTPAGRQTPLASQGYKSLSELGLPTLADLTKPAAPQAGPPPAPVSKFDDAGKRLFKFPSAKESIQKLNSQDQNEYSWLQRSLSKAASLIDDPEEQQFATGVLMNSFYWASTIAMKDGTVANFVNTFWSGTQDADFNPHQVLEDMWRSGGALLVAMPLMQLKDRYNLSKQEMSEISFNVKSWMDQKKIKAGELSDKMKTSIKDVKSKVAEMRVKRDSKVVNAEEDIEDMLNDVPEVPVSLKIPEQSLINRDSSTLGTAAKTKIRDDIQKKQSDIDDLEEVNRRLEAALKEMKETGSWQGEKYKIRISDQGVEPPATYLNLEKDEIDSALMDGENAVSKRKQEIEDIKTAIRGLKNKEEFLDREKADTTFDIEELLADTELTDYLKARGEQLDLMTPGDRRKMWTNPETGETYAIHWGAVSLDGGAIDPGRSRGDENSAVFQENTRRINMEAAKPWVEETASLRKKLDNEKLVTAKISRGEKLSKDEALSIRGDLQRLVDRETGEFPSAEAKVTHGNNIDNHISNLVNQYQPELQRQEESLKKRELIAKKLIADNYQHASANDAGSLLQSDGYGGRYADEGAEIGGQTSWGERVEKSPKMGIHIVRVDDTNSTSFGGGEVHLVGKNKPIASLVVERNSNPGMQKNDLDEIYAGWVDTAIRQDIAQRNQNGNLSPENQGNTPKAPDGFVRAKGSNPSTSQKQIPISGVGFSNSEGFLEQRQIPTGKEVLSPIDGSTRRIDSPEMASTHVAEGGKLSDIPDELLLDALVSNVGGRFMSIGSGGGINGMYRYRDESTGAVIGLKYPSGRDMLTPDAATPAVTEVSSEIVSEMIAERMGYEPVPMRTVPVSAGTPGYEYKAGAALITELVHNRRDGQIESARFDERNGRYEYNTDDISPVKMMLLDLVLDNQDRHDGNFLLEVGDNGASSVIPIDHSMAMKSDAIDEYTSLDQLMLPGLPPGFTEFLSNKYADGAGFQNLIATVGQLQEETKKIDTEKLTASIEDYFEHMKKLGLPLTDKEKKSKLASVKRLEFINSKSPKDIADKMLPPLQRDRFVQDKINADYAATLRENMNEEPVKEWGDIA